MAEETSILRTIKKMIGGAADTDEFDVDLIVAINSAISTLFQLGIETLKPDSDAGFSITGETETWDDLIDDYKYLDMVKTYVYLKVRLVFDPPQNSFLVDAIQSQIKEIEWRITVAVETDNNSSHDHGGGGGGGDDILDDDEIRAAVRAGWM